MRIAGSVALAVGLLGAHPAAAVTLEELLARNLEARGGRERLQALSSLRLTGKVVVSAEDFSLEMRLTRVVQRPSANRTDATLQGLTAVRAWDGREGWQVMPFQGRREAERLSTDEAKELARLGDLDGPLLGAAENGIALAYLGTEDVDGTEAHKIRVTRSDGDVEHVFLDPDRYLEIRIETRTRIRGAEVIEERDLGSYEPVEGVLAFLGLPVARRAAMERD